MLSLTLIYRVPTSTSVIFFCYRPSMFACALVYHQSDTCLTFFLPTYFQTINILNSIFSHSLPLPTVDLFLTRSQTISPSIVHGSLFGATLPYPHGPANHLRSVMPLISSIPFACAASGSLQTHRFQIPGKDICAYVNIYICGIFICVFVSQWCLSLHMLSRAEYTHMYIHMIMAAWLL